MVSLLTSEKLNIDLNKPLPEVKVVPGTPSDPNTFSEDRDYAAEVMKKVGEKLPEPAKVVDQPKV